MFLLCIIGMLTFDNNGFALFFCVCELLIDNSFLKHRLNHSDFVLIIIMKIPKNLSMKLIKNELTSNLIIVFNLN